MNFRYILYTLSLILRYISVVLLIPCICAVILKEYNAIIPSLLPSVLSFIVGNAFKSKDKKGEEFNNINKGEAFATVLCAWIMFALLGSVSYLCFGLKPVDALFESVSGVTTTGATVLTDFSLYPKTMFFWRSFSQWLGGMGILVLFIAVLPKFAVAGRQMFFAESPGASSTDSKLTPRIRQTSAVLWAVYLFITIVECAILIFEGMPVFDAVCNSLSTMAGGGFSPEPYSIMGYASSKFIWTISLFMFLSGMNFALQYKVYIKWNFKALWKDEEFKLYCATVAIFSVIIAGILFFSHSYTMKKAIETSLFQVISIITTTGFASVDFNEWNLRAKLILFILMFCGASIGSASGGLKLLRIIFMYKYLRRQLSKIFHPNGVYPIKINRITVSEDVVRQMVAFVMFYYFFFAVSAFLLVFAEQNAVVGLSGAIATIGNVGPSFGQLGPMGNFSELHTFSKFVCMFNMLIGRLELIPFLAVLHPDFWSSRK